MADFLSIFSVPLWSVGDGAISFLVAGYLPPEAGVDGGRSEEFPFSPFLPFGPEVGEAFYEGYLFCAQREGCSGRACLFPRLEDWNPSSAPVLLPVNEFNFRLLFLEGFLSGGRHGRRLSPRHVRLFELFLFLKKDVLRVSSSGLFL